MAVSNEPAVHVRTRALKALSSIIAADPTILSRVSELLDLVQLLCSILLNDLTEVSCSTVCVGVVFGIV